MMETMESSFYHDSGMKKAGLLKNVKSNMTLDFANASAKSKQKKLSSILNSPDINLLKLASPELERMIISQGTLTTTPTPTTQILFPKSVTEEQEAYARGFVDALAELHGGKPGEGPEGEDVVPMQVTQLPVSNPEMPASSTYTTLTTVSNVSNTSLSNGTVTTLVKPETSQQNVYAYRTVSQLPGSVLPRNNVTNTVSAPVSTSISQALAGPQEILVHNQPRMPMKSSSPALQYTGQHQQLIQIKDEEPQRVPSLSPQLTPINMVAQEGIKLERKRARNRLAARKCRTRKLERISRLEDRVSELKGHNTNLVNTASDLREQVFKLKQQILEHVSSGCKVMLSANML